MKKMIACVSLLVLVLSITYSAFAWQTSTEAWWFNLNNVQCVNTTTLKYLNLGDNDSNYPNKSKVNNFYSLPNPVSTAGRVYVYHTVTGGGGNAYTNLIHLVKYNSGSYSELSNATLRGEKWATPAQWIPIQGTTTSIPDDKIYSVAVRGNTKHYENYGATSINFRIGIEPNQQPQLMGGKRGRHIAPFSLTTINSYYHASSGLN